MEFLWGSSQQTRVHIFLGHLAIGRGIDRLFQRDFLIIGLITLVNLYLRINYSLERCIRLAIRAKGPRLGDRNDSFYTSSQTPASEYSQSLPSIAYVIDVINTG
ncbi:hypothetical protein FRC14_006331 [Serendipita sp. 396]|nr:hypothetical protein FRC14_006331 [Serendipita sp. 396]KAG8823827.1 hypothetical protein FRC19_003058 [Serendipita sp. 401]KAG8835209.1 hypothetical protein FRC18_000832 [Serendipita sp. 400]KAG8856152.1 hypothetical protein FRB91_001157 [Serendipita sp. 411]KAG9053829.1 hypothetical protein FS842_007013 [Serendipita sp. 407]